jgi:transmembrane sensor
MEIKNYQTYLLEDFLADKEFRQWVDQPDVVSNAFWEEVQATFPEKKELIAQAQLILLGFHTQEEKISEENLEKSWQKLKEKQNLPTYSQKSQKQIVFNTKVYLYRVAATLTLLMVIGAVVWYQYIRFEPMVYQTKYGQMQTIVLPDGSKVTLNANSRLEINQAWTEEGCREVVLTGEAYFEVEKKQATKQKFVVHTADLEVVVLGTSFNVSDRNAKTKVVLKEGAVTLKLKNEEKPTQKEEVVMQVGELVEFSKKEKKLVKQNVNTDNFSSWKENKLIFEDTAMKDIALLVQENYGLKVKFQDESLAKRKITGTIPSENLKILLNSLETIFNIKITEQSGELIFE